MADTGIFATTTEVQRKAGVNASSVSNVEAYINDFIAQAENEINVATRYDWSANYAGLSPVVKSILKEAASNLAAIYIIMYDMSGFTSRYEAETMLDVLRDGYVRTLSLLRDVKARDFMNDA